MRTINQSFRSHSLVRPVLILSALFAIAGCSQPPTPSAQATTTAPEATTTAQAPSSSQEVQLMFVQTADDIQVNPTEKTFRLVDVNQQTLYFADRPERLAGHYKMDDYLKEWTEGDNNFGEDPPNATLSVYEPGQAGNSIVVVEISNPVVEGDDIVYSYQLIEGTMPAQGGATAIFIDWVPARPGVGPGGVGKPGVVGVGV